MSRLQEQLAKTLAKIRSDPQLTTHRFFAHWNRRRPQAALEQLYEYCATQAVPVVLLLDIAEAVNATWPGLATSDRGTAAVDTVLMDLCCHMSLVACERAVRTEAAGMPRAGTAVFNVGMFAREAAAIVAAVWIGCGLRLSLRATPDGHQLHLPDLIHDYAELQFGRKTLEEVIDDEISCRVQSFVYPKNRAGREMLPEWVHAGLDRMEEVLGVRPLIAIDGQQGHLQVDAILSQRLMHRWKVGVFFYAREREELSEPVRKRWEQLEQTMLTHFTGILKAGDNMTDTSGRTRGRAKVFISYCRADAQHLDYVMEHLGVLEAHAAVELWDDRKIDAGDEWRAEIDRELQSCSVAAFLVSPSFLKSSFIQRVEVPALLERHRTGGMQLMPILIRNCPWEAVPWLARIQMRPGGKALDSDPARRDDQLTQIALEILRMLRATTSGFANA